MKIKQLPEDFKVEEISSIKPKKQGSHSLYLLEKNNIDFLSAEREIRRKIKFKQTNISFAGIKDRRAITTQYITIKGKYGNKIDFKTNQISLKNIGFTNKPLETGDLKGNKFTITLRDLTEEDIKKINSNIEKIKQLGFINYFDSQRFGEILAEEGFIAKHLMRENYELALKLYFSPSDKISPTKNEANKIIQKNWGKWKKILELLRNIDLTGNEQKIISSLENNNNFVNAFKLIELKVREILMASYQSYLWNRCLSELIKSKITNTKEVEYAAGKLNFPELTKESYNQIEQIEIPMIDKTVEFKNQEVNNIMQRILKKEKLKQSELRIKKMGNIFFKSRNRKIIIHPKGLQSISTEEDTENPGKQQLKIKFELEKGSYATILLKFLEL